MKIICVGRNYINHARELNNPVPDKPLIFMKPSSALLINEKPFYYPEFSTDIHYEVELVIRMGKNGKHIQKEFAKSYLDQVSVGIDFTARDIQAECKKKGHPWEIAKGFNGSAVLGKWIDADDITSLEFSLDKNSERVQVGRVADMIFSIEDILCYVSKFFTLNVGDMIYTGTPEGVGPVKIGDILEGYIGDQKLLSCEIK